MTKPAKKGAKKAHSSEAVAKKKQQRKLNKERRKQRQLEIYEKQQSQIVDLLKRNGEDEWRKLESRQWRKQNVLAVFHSGKIPPEMEEDLFHKNAPRSIRENRDIFLARMARDEFVRYYEPFNTESSPCPIPYKFTMDKEVQAAVVERFHDKGIMLSIFYQLHRRVPDGFNEFYCMLSPSLKRDIDLVVAANRRNSLLISNVPLELTRDSIFWIDVIGRDVSFWDKLPEEFRGNPDFVRAIKDFNSYDFASRVLRACPVLTSDRDVWTTIIESSFSDGNAFPSLLLEFAPMHIRGDAELMVRACRSHCYVLEVLSAQFRKRREFVAAAFESSENALFSISDDLQCLYPDLVAEAILNLPKHYFPSRGLMFMGVLEDQIADALWTNHEVVEAWFSAGGWIHYIFPKSLKDDKAFGLLVAEHCSSGDFRDSVSETLRGDKEFMMQAVEKQSRVLLEACEGLNRDFDVALIAFAFAPPHAAKYGLVHVLLQSSDGKAYYRESMAKLQSD